MIPGLPAGPRRLAFRAFIRVIQDAPAFANGRVVKTWRVWNGTGAVAEPTTDQMPAVMLRLLGGPVERLATNGDPSAALPTVDIRTQPTVMVETWVKGNNADDAMDLFDAIDDTLFPADPARRAAIRAAFAAVGISDWWPDRDVLPETTSDYDAAFIRSAGAYQFTLDLTQ